MLELINSTEHYKLKAKYFSIHCFVHEKVKFYTTHTQLINKSECKKMKSYIDIIIDEENPFLHELIKEYMHLLEDNNLLGLIAMKPGDPYFEALCSKGKNTNDIDEVDILVDSY